jgi:cell division transport system ATP-binding protein
VIRFAGVSKRFGSKEALASVSWEVPAGERVVVLGASGSGKTTLLRLITMELLPTEGVVQVGDFSSQRMSGGKRIRLRRSLGIVFEDLRLIRDRSVNENLALALQVRGEWDGKRVAERVKEALERVGAAERGPDAPAMLSSGEKQRVAVARALVGNPAIVVADEPTRHLGSEPVDLILDALRETHARGATVVLATHDENVARGFGGTIYRLADGRLEAAEGSAAMAAGGAAAAGAAATGSA